MPSRPSRSGSVASARSVMLQLVAIHVLLGVDQSGDGAIALHPTKPGLRQDAVRRGILRVRLAVQTPQREASKEHLDRSAEELRAEPGAAEGRIPQMQMHVSMIAVDERIQVGMPNPIPLVVPAEVEGLLVLVQPREV